MANFALPDTFFPTTHERELLYKNSGSCSFCHELKTVAYSKLLQGNPPFDKELEKFISTAIPWQELSESEHTCPDLDPTGEIAISNLVKHLVQQKRSLAHVIAAVGSSIEIIRCYDADTVTIPQRYKASTVILIVEPNACVTVYDKRALEDGMHARWLTVYISHQAKMTVIADYKQSGYGLYEEQWFLESSAELSYTAHTTGGKKTVTLQHFYLHEAAKLTYAHYQAFAHNEESALLTTQKHVGKESTSSLLVKSALTGHARSFFRGTISIEESAANSEAELQHRSLHLSQEAKTCAIPSLEVKTDRVSCKHGSAISTYHAQDLAYLYLRGFDNDSAHRLLLAGFFKEQPAAIPFQQESKKRLLAHIE